ARTVGVASVELGAGRRRVEDAVDPRVGFEFHRRAGDRVSEGEPLLTVHAADAAGAATAAHRLTDAIRISPEPPASQPLILERIVG
ncbi:MAG: thymidine phosphorylase, partial [Gemmatimonadales bacterium]|nr:thymidine phosphorylase [Candidatus Palauibacter irciniicola]